MRIPGGVAFGAIKGHEHATDKSERVAAKVLAAQQSALLVSITSNAALAKEQRAASLKITKDKNDELAVVRADLFFARRMRVPAFCPGVTGPAQAPGAARSKKVDFAAGYFLEAWQGIFKR